MPFITPEGTRVPTGTDNYDLTADLRKMAESQSTIVSVASTSMRTAMVAAMTAAGRTPSPTRPLWVDRQDLGPEYALEYTTDGSTWKSVPGEIWETMDGAVGWNGSPPDNFPRTMRQGYLVQAYGTFVKSAASASLAANTPLIMGSIRASYRPWTSRILGYAVTQLGPGIVRYNATTQNITVEYTTAQTIASGYWCCLNGLTWQMQT